MNFLISHILDVVCAAAGVLALLRARRCAHGRIAVYIAGGTLVLYALTSISWYLWAQFVYWPEYESMANPVTGENSILQLYEVLSPVRTILGSLLLVATLALLIAALMIRGRREFLQPQPYAAHPGAPHSGAQYAWAQHRAAYGAPGPQPQQPAQPSPGPGPGQAAQPPPPNPSHPGQWSPPPQPGQAPPHGAPPPDGGNH